MMSKVVKLQTKEEEIVTVDVETISKSVLIKNMIDDGGIEETIPLPQINTSILNKIIEFLTHLKDNQAPEIQKPIFSTNIRDLTTEFYANYIDVDIDTTKQIVLAANYLDIAPLLVLGCTKIAIAIKGKSIDEMREIFGIENDLTPEEQAEEYDENKYSNQEEEKSDK